MTHFKIRLAGVLVAAMVVGYILADDSNSYIVDNRCGDQNGNANQQCPNGCVNDDPTGQTGGSKLFQGQGSYYTCMPNKGMNCPTPSTSYGSKCPYLTYPAPNCPAGTSNGTGNQANATCK
jgi:hypothetical protein